MLNREVSDFLENDVDLLQVAIHNSRRLAENEHDFECAKVLVDLDIDGVSGGDLADCVLHTDNNESVEVKTIIEIGTWDSDDFDIVPLEWLTYDEFRARRSALDEADYDPEIRYPANATSASNRRGNPTFIIRGGKIFRVGVGTAGETETIGLYVCRYFPSVLSIDPDDYSSYEDYLLSKGGNYLQWQTIVELNHLNKHFVFRQEGNLMPPEKHAERALEALKLQDNFQFAKLPAGHL